MLERTWDEWIAKVEAQTLCSYFNSSSSLNSTAASLCTAPAAVVGGWGGKQRPCYSLFGGCPWLWCMQTHLVAPLEAPSRAEGSRQHLWSRFIPPCCQPPPPPPPWLPCCAPGDRREASEVRACVTSRSRWWEGSLKNANGTGGSGGSGFIKYDVWAWFSSEARGGATSYVKLNLESTLKYMDPNLMHRCDENQNTRMSAHQLMLP